MQREKGKRGEREVAALLRDHGYPGRRTSQYAGVTGDSSDVVGLDGFHLEVKRQERTNIHEWFAQSKRDARDDVPTVVHRRSGDEWLITLPFEEFLEAIKSWYPITCGECRHYDEKTGACLAPLGFVYGLHDPDWYCADGERRTE